MTKKVLFTSLAVALLTALALPLGSLAGVTKDLTAKYDFKVTLMSGFKMLRVTDNGVFATYKTRPSQDKYTLFSLDKTGEHLDLPIAGGENLDNAKLGTSQRAPKTIVAKIMDLRNAAVDKTEDTNFKQRYSGTYTLGDYNAARSVWTWTEQNKAKDKMTGLAIAVSGTDRIIGFVIEVRTTTYDKYYDEIYEMINSLVVE